MGTWTSLTFRFQTGSIKRNVSVYIHRRSNMRFDSKLVRLKGDAVGVVIIFAISVSIPNWFD